MEGIPLAMMNQGIAWRWETWGQSLDALDGSGLGINAGSCPAAPRSSGDAAYGAAGAQL